MEQISNPGRTESIPLRVNRRSFLTWYCTGSALAAAAAAGIGYYAKERAPFLPELVRETIVLPREHSNLAGLRLGFIADTHLGPVLDETDVDRAVQLIVNERPDLVLLGGDYISASPRFAEPAAEILGQLVRESGLGAVAVLGNHDCAESGRAEIVTDALEARGIGVLRNSSVKVATGQGDLWIAGVDEALMARADPARTFAGVPQNAATLALWHEPDYAGTLQGSGAFAQLSGHSHGGQVRLPGIGPMFLPKGGERYVIGWNSVGSLPIYTSRGVGVFMPPVRVNCPPEVTLFTLVASE